MSDLKRIDNFLPAQRGLGIVFQKTPMGPASNFHWAARDQDLGAGNGERLGRNENRAKPLKTNSLRKRRNETAVKSLKTHKDAKSLIRRS
jgi:hypothetical protein